MQSITTNTGWIYLSQGRTDLMLKVRIALSVLYVVAFIVGLQAGVLGVAVGYAVANMISMPVNLYTAGRLINMTVLDIIMAVSGIILCTLGMFVVVWGVGLMLPRNWSPWVYLAIQIPLGVSIYGVLLHVFNISAYKDVRHLVATQLKSYPPLAS